jgi:hypothetical protein
VHDRASHDEELRLNPGETGHRCAMYIGIGTVILLIIVLLLLF